MYERKVVYLFQYHGNTRGKNVGYVKWSRNSENAKLILNIKGLHLTKDMIGECSLLLEKRKVRLGKVYLKNAVAEGKYMLDRELSRRLADENISPAGILVTFGETVCAASFSEDTELDLSVYGEMKREAGEKEKIIEGEIEKVKEKNNIKEKDDLIKKDDLIEKDKVGNVDNKKAKEKGNEAETEAELKPKSGRKLTIESKSGTEPETEDIYTRLKELFPTVHPFEKAENKEYLSITPREIEFFRKEYFTLVNNSFLLHGYQNYKYLLLGKDFDDNKYLIGVPGVFFEKEEMMAKMFGFDLFLPALDEEKKQGCFGYYIKALE